MACTATDNPCVIAGDDFIYSIDHTENDKITPIDLTGATAKMDLRANVTDATITQAMSGGITSAIEGKMQFTLTDLETAALLPRTESSKILVFSIKITYQDLSEQTILTGTLSLEQAATV